MICYHRHNAHSRFTASTRDGGKYLTPFVVLGYSHPKRQSFETMSKRYVWGMMVSMGGQVPSGFTMQFQNEKFVLFLCAMLEVKMI